MINQDICGGPRPVNAERHSRDGMWNALNRIYDTLKHKTGSDIEAIIIKPPTPAEVSSASRFISLSEWL